jgi:hypothetical protein
MVENYGCQWISGLGTVTPESVPRNREERTMKLKASGLAIAAALAFAALITPFFLSESPTFAAYPEGAEYIGNAACKVCHNKKAEGEQWAVWKTKDHAKAFETLLSDEAKQVAQELGLDKPPAESPECLRCHVTGYNYEKEEFHPKLKKEDGVQCETCHGPGSLHQKDGQAFLFQKKTDLDMSANHLKIDANLCKTCHNTDSPTWDPEKYTLESGEKVGFDFEQAKALIAHPNPLKAEEE